MKYYNTKNLMKATQERFPVALFIMLFSVVLNFERIDEILKYYHSDVSY